MRRADRKITDEETKDLLEKGEYGVLSTASKEGIPYGIPLNYCVVGDCLYFHCALEGRKIDNMLENPHASFCVTGGVELLPEQFSTRYESVVVSGTVSEAFDDKKQEALEAIIRKYASAYIAEGQDYIIKMSRKTRVFGIRIEAISGKARK